MTEEKWVDAIREGKIVTITEREARDEDLFVLRARQAVPQEIPKTSQIAKETQLKSSHTAPKWKSYEPEYKKNNVIRELMDNFQWEIGKARKQRGLSRLQLANVLGVPEAHIKMVETGELPSDDFILISKIQNYLGINLRRDGKTFAPQANMNLPNTQHAEKNIPGPAYIPKPNENVSLADLQRLKAARDKQKIQTLQRQQQPFKAKDAKENKDNQMLGSDIVPLD